MIELSPRLRRIADYLPTAGRFADIGSDHAYLPIYMVSQHPLVSAIAGEVVEGPYQAACLSVERYAVSDRIECRLGDGLSILQPGEVQAVSICGMGGATIREILERSPDVVNQLHTLALQPNTQPNSVRAWAALNGWMVEDEDLILDGGIIYDVLQLKKGQANPLSEAELWFGPLNIKRRHPFLLQRVQEEIDRSSRVLEGLKQAKTSDPVESKIQHIQQWQSILQQLSYRLKEDLTSDENS